MIKNIWFNRTFSTASHYVEMIRNNPDRNDFNIFATHPKRHSLMLQVADYAELEPILQLDEYPAYCLDFCKRHKIDIFIPHYGLNEIVKHRTQFEEIGTKVMLAGDENLLSLVDDKGMLFETLKNVSGLHIPDYYVVQTLNEFMEAYTSLADKGHRVCIKPVSGEGGAGFRIVTEDRKSISSLYRSVDSSIHLDEIIRLLGSEPRFQRLMVMEYMQGNEYSVDCLGTPNGIAAAIPRKKVEGRIRALECNDELISMAHSIHKELPLQYNFNIQFIYQGSTPKLLEINPRTSGGLYTTCLSGINFPYLAVKLILDQEIEIPVPKYNIYATHIEKEVLLSRQF